MKCFSLFSGIGGFEVALRKHGHEIVGACEIDKHARAVYTRHFPNIRIWEDATKINPSELPDFDLLVAGFPCQPFSGAGKRKGFDDTRGTLFFEIARIAREKRPCHLLLENVKGLLHHREGQTMRTILKTLDDLEYDTETCVLNTADFLPQNRKRVFFVCTLRGSGKDTRQIFPVTKVDKQPVGSRKTSQRKGEWLYATAGTIDANYSKGGGARTLVLQKIIDGKQGMRVYDPKGLSTTLTANSGGVGGKTGLYTIPIMFANKTMNSRRLKTHNEPSSTLTAGSNGIYDGKNIRKLTPTECERLQGFPDGWTAGLSDNARYRCLGNAISVPVIEHVLEKLSEFRKLSKEKR